jgi:hypothetical protein
VVLIPLVGNVAEHLAAVQASWKNKMDLSLAISVGSSMQVALFVAPLLVFISLAMGNPLTLIFNDSNFWLWEPRWVSQPSYLWTANPTGWREHSSWQYTSSWVLLSFSCLPERGVKYVFLPTMGQELPWRCSALCGLSARSREH